MYATIIYGEMTQLKPQYVLMLSYIIFTDLGYNNECQSYEEVCVPERYVIVNAISPQ